MPQFTFCPQCNTRYDTAGMPAGKRLCCRECRAILSVQDDAASMPTIDPAPGSQQSTLSVADVNGRAAPGQEEPVIQALTDASGEEKYAVEDEIARGGMGMILKALDRDIRRPVAMKVMLRETDENKRARFVEEAQVTGQLEHPNIMPIHELGLDAQGQLFFTMKLVKGRSLADVLKDVGRPSGSPGDPEDRPTLGRLLNAFIAVCNAIAFAHAKGVVHRDLKPANIMLGDYGEVLVMDWGLAKPGAAVASVGSPSWQSDRLEACPTDEESDAKLAGMVRSLREESSGSKTADGVLIGTPHYMPPEQAEGRIEEIDARSDIYSLGAILYEILTLQTPCEGRTIFALVSNVSQGNIRPPHERAPQRNIPPELAAVAMKALARRKEDCYQRVEDLRRDIELYLEGRAVSAKDDTLWEAIVKLVKRNRGASVATALAAAVIVVLVAVGYRLNLQEKRAALEARNEAVAARKLAEKTLADLQAEQQQRQQAEAARRAERKKSVPAFVGAARTALTQMKNDDALAYLRAALDYDPENTEALLLESQLLICLREYAGAVGQLGKYLALKPNDADARKLAELAAQATPGDPAFAPAFSEVFSRQKAHYFVASLSQDTNKLLAAYKQRLDEALPGMNLGEALSVSDSGGFRAVGYPKMGDLTPLMGIPLTELILQNCPVRDLTPLKGMQLTSLRLSGCRNVEDLGPLRGMPLTYLNLGGCSRIKDLAPLAGMPLREFGFSDNAFVKDLSPLKGMPLTHLGCGGVRTVTDLAPLQGMPLTSLDFSANTRVKDFSFLKGMKLDFLGLSYTSFSDVGLLKGMPLTILDLRQCPVGDLAPLSEIKLTDLHLNGTRVHDLTPLKGMPLACLSLTQCEVTDLTALRGMPLRELRLDDSAVADLSPLEGMKLDTLFLTPKRIVKGMEAIRTMTTLTMIRLDDEHAWPPAEFWKKYDAGEFK